MGLTVLTEDQRRNLIAVTDILARRRDAAPKLIGSGNQLQRLARRMRLLCEVHPRDILQLNDWQHTRLQALSHVRAAATNDSQQNALHQLVLDMLDHAQKAKLTSI